MILPHLSSLDHARPLLLLLAALALDAWLGDMPALFARVPHPVALVGRVVAELERRLNREKRSESDRRVRGIVTVALMILAAILAGLAAAWICRWVRFGWALESLLVAVLLAQRGLYDHVVAVAEALETDGLAAGREAVRHIVGRDPQSLDEHGVARAGIESLAENFGDGVVAPVLFYALFGLPGIFAYKTANTLDSMIGHLSPRYRAFGWAAARLDDALNFVPARLAGFLIAAAAAAVPAASAPSALRIMWRDAGKHRSVNAGWPEAAMAGALGLALAGPRRYLERVVDDPWLGEGRARANAADMRRALAVYVVACAIEAGLVAAAYLALAWSQAGPSGSFIYA
jgi:adenosylcobinamide-phosphate synthase